MSFTRDAFEGENVGGAKWFSNVIVRMRLRTGYMVKAVGFIMS